MDILYILGVCATAGMSYVIGKAHGSFRGFDQGLEEGRAEGYDLACREMADDQELTDEDEDSGVDLCNPDGSDWEGEAGLDPDAGGPRPGRGRA